jgi:hypothetical protein
MRWILFLTSVFLGACSAPSEKAQLLDRVIADTNKIDINTADTSDAVETHVVFDTEEAEAIAPSGGCSEFIRDEAECNRHFSPSGGWSPPQDCCWCKNTDCGAPCNTALDCEGQCVSCSWHPDGCLHDEAGFCSPSNSDLLGCYEYLDDSGELFSICSG